MIYLDHNATTPVLPAAREAIMGALTRGWGNPSSAHAAGRRARALVEDARGQVAALVGLGPEEGARVVFVSGATEAIHHAVEAAGPGRVIRTAVEHPAVLAALAQRPDRHVEVFPVDGRGRVDADALVAHVDRGPRPALVIAMAANNETGVLGPMGTLTRRLDAREVPLLGDATQLAGRLDVRAHMPTLPPYLVLAAHKMGGPKGVGALVVRDPQGLPPLIDGGGQEGGRRGGTEFVPAIAGFGEAARWVREHREAEAQRLVELRGDLQIRLLEALPGAAVAGDHAPRLPNTLSLILPPGARAADVAAWLDERGLCVSGGSACDTGSPKPSRVLTAMGYPPEECFRALRLSLGWSTTAQDLDAAVSLITEGVRAVLAPGKGLP